MEYFLAASVIGAGYVFNNNGKNRTNEPSYIANVSNNEKPNGSNIYNNTSTIQIRKIILCTNLISILRGEI